MLISIFGLPPNIKYQDLKDLIKQQCKLTDFIVDNIVSASDGTKKVRIGLTDDEEGHRLVKGLNGYRFGSFVVKVSPVGKSQPQQPQQSNFVPPQSQYPVRNDYSNQGSDYHGSHRPPVDPVSRPQPWVSGSQAGWSQELQLKAQGSQNSFGYEHQAGKQGYEQHPPFHSHPVVGPGHAGPPMDSRYGQKPFKADIRRPVDPHDHNRNLRSVELVDSHSAPPPVQQSRYPGQGYQPHDKPVNPIKDNFQGPSYVQPNQPQGQGQTHGPAKPWVRQNSPHYDKPYDDDRRGSHDQRPDQKLPSQMRNKNYEKAPFSLQRKVSPARLGESPERMPQGKPVSPRHAGRHMSPVRPGTSRPMSPGRSGMSRPMSPGRSGMSRPMSPGKSGMPGRPGILGRPISPARSGMPRQMSPRRSGRQMSPGGPGMPGRQMSPGRHGLFGRPMSPGRPGMSGRQMSPGRPGIPGHHLSPNLLHPGRSISPKQFGGRHLSPTRPGIPGRHASPNRAPGNYAREMPSGRPISPEARTLNQRPGVTRYGSPGRFAPETSGTLLPHQILVQGRPQADVSSGRRMSPHDRVSGPPGISGRPGSPIRRSSPHGRRSPIERGPGGRGDSPRRSISPHRMDFRYSPDRHHSEKLDKYDLDPKLKHVRPAYESVASNQAMYSGGYQQNLHDNKYPRTGDKPWQNEDKYAKKEDTRRIPSRDIEEKLVYLSERKSRSPVRRDRSPLRDRFKRHSPSPRSPRRSWALDKRRSPDMREAPPPPVWPGQNRDDDLPRRNIPDRSGKKDQHVPVWERPNDKEDLGREEQRPENKKRFEEKARNRREILNRESRNDPFAQQTERPKFSPQDDNRYDFRIHDEMRFDERQELGDFQRRSAEREDRRNEVHLSHRTIEKEFDKELEDIYRRAVEFRKKAEERRRSSEKRREDYSEDRSRIEKDESVHQFDRSRRPVSPRQRDFHRSPSEERRATSQERANWQIVNKKPILTERVKLKRDKAVNEIVNRLLERQTVCDYLEGDFEARVKEELKLEIFKIINNIFGDEDVSFIEIVIKYQAKYNVKEEGVILKEILKRFPKPPKPNKKNKRTAPETSEVPTKASKRGPPAAREDAQRPKLSDSQMLGWNMNIPPPKLANISTLATSNSTSMAGMQQLMNPLGVSQFGVMPHTMLAGEIHEGHSFMTPQMTQMGHSFMAPHMAMQMSEQMVMGQPGMVPAPIDSTPQQNSQEEPNDQFNLYLCHDDFKTFAPGQAEHLKNFLIKKIIEVTESSRGWAPDITLKGMQSLFRYEVQTKDFRSKDWLLNLDFNDFDLFSVVVYTKEELWYERAAIWLPGHSKNRSIEPMEKLKMQNKKLDGINIGDWKLVKKIVIDKGTRLYVDMPPASARALDKYKMMLSYELQKVNVFLKAVAVDKDAFDAGMMEFSITDKTKPYHAAQNTPFPLIANDASLVKITLNDSKTMTIDDARKIKEIVIYHIFRYHQMSGTLRTDFVKYGFCQPNYFGIVPENQESKKWLLSRNFGKLKNESIMVVGAEEDDVKLYPMTVLVDDSYTAHASKILERLKCSNRGVKGIYFNFWKVDPVSRLVDKSKVRLNVNIDIESLKTLKKTNYKLDYVSENNKTETVQFRAPYSYEKLEEDLKKYKNEQMDSYDVANMDLESDEDIVCLE